MRRKTARGFVCWIFIALDVFPLIGGTVVSNLLHPVGYEDVKASGLILDIAEDDLAICVKSLRNLVPLKLFSQ